MYFENQYNVSSVTKTNISERYFIFIAKKEKMPRDLFGLIFGFVFKFKFCFCFPWEDVRKQRTLSKLFDR